MPTVTFRQSLEAPDWQHLDRAAVIRAIARVRHRLEREVPASHRLPEMDPAELLLELCREIGLEPVEIIEAAGANIVLNDLYGRILPVEAPVDEFDRWLDEHGEDTFEADLAKSHRHDVGSSR